MNVAREDKFLMSKESEIIRAGQFPVHQELQPIHCCISCFSHSL
jgi:hypothetical protein